VDGSSHWTLNLPPEPLLDEIQKIQEDFTIGWQNLSYQQLYAQIPKLQVKTNILPLYNIPGIGRYDVDQETPVMTQQKWCELCIAIAKSDEHTFADLFEVGLASHTRRALTGTRAAHCGRASAEKRPLEHLSGGWLSSPPSQVIYNI